MAYLVPSGCITVSLNAHVIIGSGSPVAKQAKITTSPSLLILSCGPIIMEGGPEMNKR